MSCQIIQFSSVADAPRRGRRPHRPRGRNIRTLSFRSYDLIVESDEADLIRDAGLDMHKAEVKLRKVREQLASVRERSATQIQILATAETKLAAAIAAAQATAEGFASTEPVPGPKPRRTNSAAMARRRQFNDAMRRRVREVAASLNLSNEEIKAALTLKHEKISEFVQRHGVSFGWLLEGTGQPRRGSCELIDILDGA